MNEFAGITLPDNHIPFAEIIFNNNQGVFPTMRDAFIETLAHVSECVLCTNSYSVIRGIELYRDKINHTHKYNDDNDEEFFLNIAFACNHAHVMVDYLD